MLKMQLKKLYQQSQTLKNWEKTLKYRKALKTRTKIRHTITKELKVIFKTTSTYLASYLSDFWTIFVKNVFQLLTFLVL